MNLQSYLIEKTEIDLDNLPSLKDINIFNEIDTGKIHELKNKNKNVFNLIKALINDPNIQTIDENKVFTIKMDKEGNFSITSGKNKIILEDVILDE